MTMRFRFSTRTLFVATTLVAVLLASVGAYLSYAASRPNLAIVSLNGDASMEPYIEAKVYFIADLNAYRTSSPKRWDAVVFDPIPPTKISALWVAGLPGETISFVNGRMLINGIEQDLPESVFGKGWIGPAHPNGSEITEPCTVPTDCYYLVGGTATAAKDSRSFGVVTRARIVGRVNR